LAHQLEKRSERPSLLLGKRRETEKAPKLGKAAWDWEWAEASEEPSSAKAWAEASWEALLGRPQEEGSVWAPELALGWVRVLALAWDPGLALGLGMESERGLGPLSFRMGKKKEKEKELGSGKEELG
jgi:hypothetical protein